MINILFVADKLSIGGSTIHGVTRLFSWWIPRFNKERFNVSVCSLRKRDAGVEYLEGFGIDVICQGKGKFDPRTLLDLIRIIKEKKIHIVHLHGYGATTFGRIAAIFTGISHIVHEHMYDKGIPIYQRGADRMLGWSSRHAIAVSESVREFLVQYRALPPDMVKVIYNGVPLEMFKNTDKDAISEWKAKLNIPDDHKVVTIVGRLDPIKGHTYFLDAAARVLQKVKSVTFLVVGDGELLPVLQARRDQLGIAERVIFMGHCDAVPSLLQVVDIKVISSLSEGVPITLFEAMAAGCAVVASRVGGLGEVIKDGDTGFLVPSCNATALSEKIVLLLNDAELLKRMKARAKTVARQYDISATVSRFEAYYEQIVNG